MDESDAFEREVDNAKEAGGDFVYGVWSENRQLVGQRDDVEASSGFVIRGGKNEVVEVLDDGGGVNSKLAVISLPFIKVDADVDMEVFVTSEVCVRLS